MTDIVTETYYERNKERIKAHNKLPEVRAHKAETMRLYRESHPEYVKKGCLLTKKYTAENKEQVREKNRQWRKTEKGKAAAKRYDERHPETKQKARKKWNQTDIGKEIRRKWKALWSKSENGKIAKKNDKYKRRSRTVGTFTSQEWCDLCNKYDNKCLCCGEEAKLTVDHVVPLAKGGENIISNIQPLCRSCNSKKNVKVIDYR